MPAEVDCTVARHRGRVAALTRCVRSGERDETELTDARRDLAEAQISAYVQRVLDASPPLTDEQRTRLAELLRPARAGAGARKSGR